MSGVSGPQTLGESETEAFQGAIFVWATTNDLHPTPVVDGCNGADAGRFLR